MVESLLSTDGIVSDMFFERLASTIECSFDWSGLQAERSAAMIILAQVAKGGSGVMLAEAGRIGGLVLGGRRVGWGQINYHAFVCGTGRCLREMHVAEVVA